MRVAAQRIHARLQEHSVLGFHSRRREIFDLLRLEVSLHLLAGLLRGQEAHVSVQVLGDLVRVVCVFVLAGAAQRYLNDLVLAEEELAVFAHRVRQGFEGARPHVFEREHEDVLVGVHGFLDVLNKVLLG